MAEGESKFIPEDHHRQTHRWSFLQGLMFTGSATTVNIIALFLETIIAVRLLDTKSYGIYVLLVVVVNFFAMAIDLGFKTGATQLIAGSNHIRQVTLVNSLLTFRLFAIAFVFVIIWLGQDLLILLDSSRSLLQYSIYLSLMLAVLSLDELLYSMFQGFQAYHQMAIVRIVRSVLRLSFSVVFLAVFKLGMAALIYSWIFSYSVSIAYQYIALPVPKRFTFHRRLIGEILRFGFPLQMSRLLWFASDRINVLLIGVLAGSTAVAFYDVAAKIPAALYRMFESFISVYFPRMTALLAEGKRQEAGLLLARSLRLISFTMALVALIAVLFSQQIVTFLFSEKYLASSMVFVLLIIALHMGLMVQLMGYTLTSAGYPGRSLIENAIRAVLIIVANLVLIPSLGILGAAIATLTANYVSNPISIWLLQRSNIPVSVSTYAKQTAVLLLCTVFFWWLQPPEFAFKMVFILFFIILNLLFSTITRNDLALVLPKVAIERLGIRPKK